MSQLSLDIGKRPAWDPIEKPPDLSKSNIYVGTSGYYFDDWLSRFNPPKLTKRQQQYTSKEEIEDQDRLRFYQKYFSFVEINATFYKLPVLQSFMDIENRSKPGMLYAIKAHRDISHPTLWQKDRGQTLMRHHMHAVAPLLDTGRFYSFLIQLDDRTYRTQERLDYLLAVGSEATKHRVDVHIEFRHVSWHTQAVLQSLKDNGIGICNTDIPPIGHEFPLKAYATTDKGYVRYSGLNKENWYPKGKLKTAKERTASRNARYDYHYTPKEMEERVAGQMTLRSKTRNIAIAFNNHFQIKAIRNAIQNLKLLKERLEQLLEEGV